MRIQSLFILIPFVAGFFWFLSYLLFAAKNNVSRKIGRFIAVVSFFFLFAFLSADMESRLMLHFTLFEQVCALAIVPCFMAYVMECGKKPVSGLYYKLCCMLPFIHLLMGVETVYSVGFNDALSIMQYSNLSPGLAFSLLTNNSQVVFYACYTYVFYFFLLTCFMLFAINLMSCAINGSCSIKIVMGFFFKGQKSELIPVQYLLTLILLLVIVPALLLGRRCYVDDYFITIAACIFLAFFVSMIAFVGTAGKVKEQSIRGLLDSVKFGVRIAEEADAAPVAMDAPEKTALQDTSVLVYAMPQEKGTNVEESMDAAFEKLMLDKKLFLNRDLSLSFVAGSLRMEKNALADYMESTYGMSFISYLNMLRVDYAEQYILDHDDATQQEIAAACGFSSASAFNTAFSKLTGVTPKIWKARYAEMSKRKA